MTQAQHLSPDSDWRALARANDVPLRPPPKPAASAPPSTERKPQLLVPLSVIREEEEAQLLAELEEEERMNREEDERLSGIRPGEPPVRRRIVEAEKPQRPQVPLKASLGEVTGGLKLELPQPSTPRPSADEVSAKLDQAIADLVNKHQTLRSRPEPPSEPEPEPVVATSTRGEPSETPEHYTVGPSGRRRYAEWYRRETAIEWLKAKAADPSRLLHEFAAEKDVEKSILCVWAQKARDEGFAPVDPVASTESDMGSKPGRRTHTPEFKAQVVAYAQQHLAKPTGRVQDVAEKFRIVDGLVRRWLEDAGTPAPSRRGLARGVPGPTLSAAPQRGARQPLPQKPSGKADFAALALELQEAQERVRELKRAMIEALGD